MRLSESAQPGFGRTGEQHPRSAPPASGRLSMGDSLRQESSLGGRRDSGRMAARWNRYGRQRIPVQHYPKRRFAEQRRPLGTAGSCTGPVCYDFEPGAVAVVQYGGVPKVRFALRQLAAKPAGGARNKDLGSFGLEILHHAVARIAPADVPKRVFQRLQHAAVRESGSEPGHRNVWARNQHGVANAADSDGAEVYVLSSTASREVLQPPYRRAPASPKIDVLTELRKIR